MHLLQDHRSPAASYNRRFVMAELQREANTLITLKNRKKKFLLAFNMETILESTPHLCLPLVAPGMKSPAGSHVPVLCEAGAAPWQPLQTIELPWKRQRRIYKNSETKQLRRRTKIGWVHPVSLPTELPLLEKIMESSEL